MTLPPDHDQRQRALNPAESFIVQAPAGSGKTRLLVERYLALLTRVEEPEQILAITFTKKAAAQMRARVIGALVGDGDDGAQIGALAEKVHANDRQHNWQLLDNTRRLRIQTIDAFCSELVRRMPWSARFGSPPGIIDDPTRLYQQAAKLTLDHIEFTSDKGDALRSEASQRLLALTDANWSQARTLLADMLKRRDKWMRLLGTGSDADFEGMWQQVVAAELRRVAGLIPPEQRTEIVTLAAFAAANLRETRSDSSVSALHEARDFPAAEHPYITQWHGIAELFLTKGGDCRKVVDVRQGFPPSDKPTKARMVALLGWATGQPELCAALRVVRILPADKFGVAQRRSVEDLARLLLLAAGELRLLFREQNLTDFIEITQRAEMALGDLEVPSDLMLTFDYRIQHLLIDEFQDTSIAHFELLAKLTAGWQPGDGRTLFFVGDPMQSIYRFRGAEVANFLRAQTTGLGDMRPERLTLCANFRSSPALVDWFNATFAEVLPQDDDAVNGAVRYSPAVAHRTETTAGHHLHCSAGTDHAQEARTIAELIAQANADPDRDQTIAVLGRARSHLAHIAAELRLRGIPFQGVELEKLGERPAIRDLVALTRALAQPTDRIAWLSLLRAPWCGMRLADIAALAEGDHTRAMAEGWRDDGVVATLSEAGRECLARLVAILDPVLHRRGRVGLRQNVEAAWLALGGPATVAGESDLDDCQRYLNLLSKLEDEQIAVNAESLHHAIADLWAGAGAIAQIQLSTIHKAKGLEFDMVFLPGLARRPRALERALLRWQELPEQLLIAPLPSSVDSENAFYEYLKHLDACHTHNELGRLLYVACTRAKKTLHLFGSVNINAKDGQPKAPPPTSLLALVWTQVRAQYQTMAATALPSEDGEDAREVTGAQDADNPPEKPAPRPLQKLPSTWSPPALPQPVHRPAVATAAMEQIEFSWAGETARIIGIVIHEILQRVDEVGWQRWCSLSADKDQQTQWQNKLLENGIAQHDLADTRAQVVAALDAARGDPKAAWIFSDAHHHIKTEWPLTGIVDGKIIHAVIDRTFIDANGVRWIIDFKSSRHQDPDPAAFLDREQQRYLAQMARYATLLSQLETDEREIKLGLYFPALRGWREW